MFSVLILLILIIVIAFTATGLSILCRGKKNSELNTAVEDMQRTVKQTTNIVCCPTNTTIRSDGNESENGFTREMAESFVDALDRAIKFGEEDEVIAGVLKGKKICSSSTPSGVGNGGYDTTSMDGEITMRNCTKC